MVQKNVQAKAPATGGSVLGYEMIEKMLEAEDFAGVNKSFSEAYEKLEKIMNDRSGGLKKQKDAEVAMRSYELTVDLIKELLKVKHQLGQAEQAKK